MSEIYIKLQILYEHIKEDEGIIDLPWCTYLLYPYYLHFNDSDFKVRAGSLIAFWGLLSDWEDGSGFPFYTGTEEYECHQFDKYIFQFINNSTEIQNQYPNLHFVIIESLSNLDKRNDFGIVFSKIDLSSIALLRSLFQFYDFNRPDNVYRNTFKEAGIEI